MFLQLLDSKRFDDYIKEKLLQISRLYARAGQLESALQVLTDNHLTLADTWVSFTLTDIAVDLAKQSIQLQGEDNLALHKFIEDEILNYGL